MRSAGKYPLRIVTSGVDATTIMQGSKRAWSYDEGGGVLVYQADLGVTAAFTRWVNNRGQGKQVAAFRVGPGDATYGGVVWRSVWNGSWVYGGTNGYWVTFKNSVGAFVSNNMTSALPTGQGVEVLSAFSWQDTSGYHVGVGGLTIGRSYVFQIVVADNRAGVIDGRKVEIVPLTGMGGTNASGQQRFAYGSEVKYTVVSVRFIATDIEATFRPDFYNANGSYAGTQINALNILADVLPQGKMFYVANDGNDNNDGMSRETPWASLSRVHERTYGPGDCILFKRGHKWSGRLTPAGNGAIGRPIILSAYGEGAHPLIDGAGYMHTPPNPTGVVQLTNQSHWIIDGFEIINWTVGENLYVGIMAYGNGGTKGLVVRNCHVHDIKGGYRAADPNLPGRWTGGIHVQSQQGQVGNYDDVLIENNTVEHVLGIGIQIWGPVDSGNSMAGAWPNLCENNVIRGNTVWGCSSDNILYQGCKNPLVEFNHSGFCGLHGRFPVINGGIGSLWGTRSDGGIQQYNHVHNTMTWVGNWQQFDGGAGGIDVWMRGTTFVQYNYTHDNVGGAFGDTYEGVEPGAILNYRYNISVNEPRIAVGRPNGLCSNSVFYSPADNFQLHWNPSNFNMRNCVVHGASLDAAWSSAALSNNVWWGSGVVKPSNDSAGIKADPLFSSSPPNLIYRDEYVSYTAGDPNTPMAAGQLERRWFGVLKSATYNTFGESSSFWVGRVRALELINLSGASALALNTNLAAGVTGPLTVQVLVRSVSASHESNWLAFVFRDSSYPTEPFVADSANKFGVLFRRSGSCQAFKGNSGQTQPMDWINQKGADEFHIVEFVFTNTAGTGSAFAGQGTRVKIFSDGLLLGTYDLDQMTQLHFAYNVLGSEWWVRKLHVFARNGIMDCYDDYTGLIPSTSSPLLNTGTAGLNPGATDFFRNAIDGTPNRGAVEATTLAGYVQTPTRIEIRGRYRIAKPASGSRNYNYDAIVRDQNFRVIPQQPVWEILPAMTGVTIDAKGVVSVALTASTGRFAIKASTGNVTRSFPCEII